MSGSARQEYSVVLRRRQVARELDRLPESEYGRVATALRELGENPRRQGVVRLRGSLHRFRVGNYRIIYRIDDRTRTVVVGAVRRRNEGTYRDIERLF